MDATAGPKIITPRWGAFILISIILSLGLYLLISFSDLKDIKENWPKYRCMPHIMPFASLYGHNTTNNFQYCMKNMFTGFGGEMLAPFYDIMGFFTRTLMGLLNSINSLRVMLATLVGGITTIFQEFTERLSMFFFQLQVNATRMRQLMNRVIGIMFSVMYMGMSGVTSAVNFGDTVMFRFLDTFCFAPETLVLTDRGRIPISSVKIGDTLIQVDSTSSARPQQHIVTAAFRFLADGQTMRKFGVGRDSIEVSTNHYVSYNGNWIEVANHPMAAASPPWSGGKTRPLICLNTNTHKIPIGRYIFSDYDETEEGDVEAMRTAEKLINGVAEDADNAWTAEYSLGFDPATHVKLANGGYARIADIQLGDALANGGKVVGLVKKECYEWIDGEDCVTPGTLKWSAVKNKWVRESSAIQYSTEPRIFHNLFVYPNSVIETKSGATYRDYIEVMSPEMREAYSAALEASGTVPTPGI